MTVDEIIADVIRREGGFVDDPFDRGGPTNHGVSLRYARHIGLDLDGDGDTDIDDIRDIGPDLARALFKEDFYYDPRIQTLPEELHPQMVDFAVNSGAPQAVMTLQEAVNEIRFGVLVEGDGYIQPDGIIGRKTRAAVLTAIDEFGPMVVNHLVSARKAFLRALAVRRPSQQRFLDGWLARAELFRVKLS